MMAGGACNGPGGGDIVSDGGSGGESGAGVPSSDSASTGPGSGADVLVVCSASRIARRIWNSNSTFISFINSRTNA